MCKKLIYLTSFVLLLVPAGNAMAQIDPATVTTGHVYLLDDVNDVDGTVPDDSANDNTGIIVGDPNVVDGLAGKALLFDGVDDGVDIPDSQFINVTGGPFPNRTVMAVFNCADVNKPEKQTVFEEGGLTRGLTIYVHEGLVYVGGWNKAEYQWNPGSWMSAPISSNEWHTVALVIRDGADATEDDKFEMWMDGELIGKAPGGQIYNHGNDNSIGYTKQNNVFHDGDGSGDGWFFEGLVDEVWILNEALTPPELAAMAGTTWPYAYGPDPANGAELEKFSAFLEWGPGDGAVSHDVYFGSSLDDVIAGAADTFLGNQPTISLLAADLVPETTYYWRVDEVSDADPNSPSIGEVWSFSLLPRRAYDPDPADGVRATGTALNLTWTPGWSPIMHQVYFGTDPDQVANAADAPLVMDVGYDTGDLHPGTTYYWRVDEFYGAETVKGPVWTFTTIVYDEETPFDYDNSVDPFISEVSLDMDPAIDLTDPIVWIAVNYTGVAAPGSVTVDEAAGTTTIIGRGADIWGTADEFQYAYTTLTMNGSMTVKVDSLAHSDDWSKAGIMIRETLEPGASFAGIFVTGVNGVRFQARMSADQDATADDAVATDEAKALTAPVWIKIERTFPMINAYYSTDGVTFIPMGWNPQVIPWTPAPIHIGLAVTSHSGAETYAEAVFSEISSDGGVAPGPLTSAEIGLQGGNAAEPMYLVLEDASGASAAVLNPDAAATQQTSATDFVVDLRNVAIDRSAVTKISLVIGDVDAPAPGGTGTLTIHNIRLMEAHELVAHWTLDESDGIIAVDSSRGGGNDGILNGTAMSWMPGDGMIGGALSFDGTASAADYVEISTADISLAAGTIAMWGNLRPEPQAPDTRYFFGHTTIPPWSDRIQLYMDSADTVLDLGLGDSHSRHQDIMSLTTETWYHVALTWDGGNYVVYVNGAAMADGDYAGLDVLNTVADIGNDGRTDDTGRTEAFNGLLDDVRIYDRALSEDEVAELAGL